MAVETVEQTMEFHEVANLFPLIQGQEFDELVKDIRENGLQQPIWTYQGKIIDGRNRYRACLLAHVAPRSQEWDGNGSLVAFVISLNVKRRHLTSSQLAAIALEVEQQLAKENKVGRPRNDGNYGNISVLSGESREKAADLLGTNAHYVTDAKRIAQSAPALIEHVKEGTLTIPDARAIADLPKERQAVVVEKAVQAKEEEGKRVSTAVKNALWEEKERMSGVSIVKTPLLTALQSSESNEWFTPAQYVEAARSLMGAIDVDPASCAFANRTVQAERYYTMTENGLTHPWGKKVWLNPPYGFDGGTSNQEIWTDELRGRYKSGEVDEAVLLVNANTEAKWFQPLYGYLICFTNHRIRFYNTAGQSSQPTQGNAFVYFGTQEERFVDLFRRFGTIVRMVERP